MYTTYGIVDPNTKWIIYVGQTNNFERRKGDHLTTHRERKASPKGSLQHWLKVSHKAKITPEFIILEVVETESESLKSETKWVEKIAAIGHPLLNRWDEHKEFISCASAERYEAIIFEATPGRRRRTSRTIGVAAPNRANTGLRIDIIEGEKIEGPITIDLLPPKDD